MGSGWEATDFDRARVRMVEEQLKQRGISDTRVLDAMRSVPRELFVPDDLRHCAYEDRALQIAANQTISQPFVVALMLQLARIGAQDVVLEVGAGSGYAAAVIGRMARAVFAIERHEQLVTTARSNLERACIRNVRVIRGDGTRGLPDEAPFDAIVVSAGGSIPPALKVQLARGGRLVIPVERDGQQTLERLTRRLDDTFEEERHGPVSFVPLVTGLPGR